MAALVLLPLAACSASSGGNGSPAGGSTSAEPPRPSASAVSTSSGATSSGVTASTPTAPVTPSTTRAPSTPIPPVATPVVPAGNDILGPTGWQTLQLGMAPAAAEGTGIFVDAPAPGGTGCVTWYAAGAAAIDTATISPYLGVVAIAITSSDKVLMTPEGMTLGWTLDQVRAAYPAYPADAESLPDGPPTIVVPQNPGAIYRIGVTAGVVVSLSLETFPQDCFD